MIDLDSCIVVKLNRKTTALPPSVAFQTPIGNPEHPDRGTDRQPRFPRAGGYVQAAPRGWLDQTDGLVLPLYHFCVHSVSLDKFVVGAGLHNSTLVDDDDLIGVGDGG